MAQLRAWTALLVVFAAVISAGAQAQRYEVVLDISLPNGETPQLRMSEGETCTIELPDAGKFGFVPALQAGNANVVVVELFDMNRTPHRRIARLEIAVGGERVPSGTAPQFGVRVARVVTR
jgi:hypothetical protein